ncbi:MAG: GYF domain-containing protein [Limisphaerales bacterium]
MSTWRYVQNGQPSAPVDTAALSALLTNGTLPPDTYVWKEGMANWLAARTLPEFADCRPASSPAVPPVPGAGNAAPPGIPGAPGSEAEDIEKNRAFGILSYLWILFVVGLIAAPNSKFAKYHANQGLVLFLSWVVVWVASFVLAFIPILGHLTILALWATLLVFVILGIVNAAGGQCKPLPLIGGFQLIK